MWTCQTHLAKHIPPLSIWLERAKYFVCMPAANVSREVWRKRNTEVLRDFIAVSLGNIVGPSFLVQASVGLPLEPEELAPDIYYVLVKANLRTLGIGGRSKLSGLEAGALAQRWRGCICMCESR